MIVVQCHFKCTYSTLDRTDRIMDVTRNVIPTKIVVVLKKVIQSIFFENLQGVPRRQGVKGRLERKARKKGEKDCANTNTTWKHKTN